MIAFAMADSEFRGGIRLVRKPPQAEPKNPNKPCDAEAQGELGERMVKRMEEMQQIEVVKPNKDILDVTKEIISQNRMILEMNTKLLLVLSTPVIFMNDEVK